jgi:hypothetical protein
MRGKQGDVRSTLAQRWGLNGKYTQTVKKILANASGIDLRL